MKSISLARLAQKMKTENLHLIDVRSAESYQQGHIPGAVHLSLEDLPNQLTQLDRTQTYYLVCQRGIKSAQATEFLAEQGFDAVNVEEGTAQWSGELERN